MPARRALQLEAWVTRIKTIPEQVEEAVLDALRSLGEARAAAVLEHLQRHSMQPPGWLKEASARASVRLVLSSLVRQERAVRISPGLYSARQGDEK